MPTLTATRPITATRTTTAAAAGATRTAPSRTTTTSTRSTGRRVASPPVATPGTGLRWRTGRRAVPHPTAARGDSQCRLQPGAAGSHRGASLYSNPREVRASPPDQRQLLVPDAPTAFLFSGSPGAPPALRAASLARVPPVGSEWWIRRGIRRCTSCRPHNQPAFLQPPHGRRPATARRSCPRRPSPRPPTPRDPSRLGAPLLLCPRTGRSR
mmetsp:Transcript_15477/g.47900  ORF Transcript_15477/g.47900 Transcript_15477/m.47900 type:complete len:212 (-) Transcript_15477:40-675(-)